MKIYQITATNIDYNIYHTVGYNYILESVRFYSTTKDIVKRISKKYNKIKITEIELITKEDLTKNYYTGTIII